MACARTKQFSYLHNEHSPVLTNYLILALLRRELGIHILKLLSGSKEHIALDSAGQLREFRLDSIIRVRDGCNNGTNCIFQRLDIALLARDDFFPVPLVGINRVEVVEILVAADSVHIGIYALTGSKAVTHQRHALPLGKRLYDLCDRINSLDIKADRTLNAVKIIIESRCGIDKQRRGCALQVKCGSELALKRLLEITYRGLSLIKVEYRGIALGDIGMHTSSFLIGGCLRRH